MGYNAIWISPTLAQADNSPNAYHGYWYGHYYETNPNFGTE